MAFDEESQNRGMFEPAGTTTPVGSSLPPGGDAATVSTAAYNDYAARVIQSVADLDAQDQALARETHVKLQEIYTLHLMGIQNPIRHAAFLKERGVILNKRTSPELATVKAVSPKERWKQRSSTMTQWKTVLMALSKDGVRPADVPQWLRSLAHDARGKEVRGIQKAYAVLRELEPEAGSSRTGPKETFDALAMEHRKAPVATMKAPGDLPKVTGYALLLIDSDQDETRVLGVFTDQDLVPKVGLKGWRE